MPEPIENVQYGVATDLQNGVARVADTMQEKNYASRRKFLNGSGS